MSAHVLLNLLTPLEKRIRCIYLYQKKKYVKEKKKSFIKQIAAQLIQDTNLISILMYHMLHNAQTQHEVTIITGFLVQRQGDQ